MRLFQRCCALAGAEDAGNSAVVGHRQRTAQHHQHAGRSQAARGHGAGVRFGGTRGQGKAPEPGRGQQEVGVPQRIFQQAVQPDHHHGHHGATLGGGQGGVVAARPVGRTQPICATAAAPPGEQHRAPQAPQEKHQHGAAQRHAQFSQQLQRQVVGMIEEGGGAAGERRQRPGKVEFAPAHTRPGLLADEGQRVGPDAEARARDVGFRQPRRAAEFVRRGRGPLRHAPPDRAIEHRRAQQQPSGGHRAGGGRPGPTAPAAAR